MFTPNQIFLTDLDAIRLRTIARRLIGQRGLAHDGGEELFELLDAAKIIPANAVRPDVVTMNSVVVYDDGSDGPIESLTLVYPERADAAQGRVSVLAPLGRTLIGARAGEKIRFGTPGDGIRTVRVRKVAYQPEAAGDWTL